VTHPSKRKGSAFEREVVAMLQEKGVAAEKVPLSGAVKGGSFDCDATISIPVLGEDVKAECKRRKRQFATIDGMLGPNAVLFCRDDRSRPLVVMTVDMFVKMARGA
jgi:Holliday junction resolvase